MHNYTFYDANGSVLEQPGEHVAFLDPTTGLTWGSRLLDVDAPMAECVEVAKKTMLCGVDGWRAPTIKEQVGIMDYDRFAPALNPILFPNMPKYGWLWTSSVGAEPPRDSAWVVNLYYGYAYRNDQNSQGRVLVVRSAPLPRQ